MTLAGAPDTIRVYRINPDGRVVLQGATKHSSVHGVPFVLRTICYEQDISVPLVRMSERIPLMESALFYKASRTGKYGLTAKQRALLHLVHSPQGPHYIRTTDLRAACVLLHDTYARYQRPRDELWAEPSPLLPLVAYHLWSALSLGCKGAGIDWGCAPSPWNGLLKCNAPVDFEEEDIPRWEPPGKK